MNLSSILSNVAVVVGIALVAISFGGRAVLLTGIVLIVLGVLVLNS